MHVFFLFKSTRINKPTRIGVMMKADDGRNAFLNTVDKHICIMIERFRVKFFRAIWLHERPFDRKPECIQSKDFFCIGDVGSVIVPEVDWIVRVLRAHEIFFLREAFPGA